MEYEQDPYINTNLHFTTNLLKPLVYLVNVVDLDINESKTRVSILVAIFRHSGHEGIIYSPGATALGPSKTLIRPPSSVLRVLTAVTAVYH